MPENISDNIPEKIPNNISDKEKECFGDMEKVFPIGPDGLRHSPESCLQCRDKTQCLGTAIRGGKGIKVKEEKVDRAYESGTMGFFERWSRKKHLHAKKIKKGES
ncbi:hypothetical protein QUF70_13980 [Desulfobacterales bacterium HSG17]|nr:hypothetical protein [Desulfobacterales bacterium HSG17]